ncbi:hypothetical protein ACO0LG_23655 [Undibacterium sp. Ji42W]|uniref:hypothetical protein n=1 Tax=Undibacterium sp. Ji42W TaxID=3413039 RepID=UPI003BF030D6
MTTEKKSIFETSKMAVYVALLANVSVFLFFMIHAIRDGAPMWSFWVPLAAFIMLEAYVVFEAYKKTNAMTMRINLRAQWTGIVFFFLALFLIMTRNWAEYKLTMVDAFILCALAGCIKDSILQAMAMHRFSGFSGI